MIYKRLSKYFNNLSKSHILYNFMNNNTLYKPNGFINKKIKLLLIECYESQL